MMRNLMKVQYALSLRPMYTRETCAFHTLSPTCAREFCCGQPLIPGPPCSQPSHTHLPSRGIVYPAPGLLIRRSLSRQFSVLFDLELSPLGAWAAHTVHLFHYFRFNVLIVMGCLRARGLASMLQRINLNQQTNRRDILASDELIYWIALPW